MQTSRSSSTPKLTIPNMRRTRATAKSRLGTPPPLTDPGWVPIRSFAFREDFDIAQESETETGKGKGKGKAGGAGGSAWKLDSNPFQSGSRNQTSTN
jgi:hypothetical protein